MAKYKSNQGRAGIMFIILVMAVIGVITIAGWFVYIRTGQHETQDTTSVPSASKLSDAKETETKKVELEPSATEPGKNLVKIPELGVQLVIPDGIKDLTYKAWTAGEVQGRPAASAKFSTASLIALDARCDPEFGPLGYISTVQGQYPGDPKDVNDIDKYGLLYKQLSTIYVIAGAGAQAACAPDNKAAMTAANVYTSEFSAAKATIEPMK